MGCFSCNAAISLSSGERVGFRDTCSACHADLHVCLHCTHHDPNAYNECRESNAERVSDRERANRCDYFELGDAQGRAASGPHRRAIGDLDSLFKKS